jgi:hypothetical protein
MSFGKGPGIIPSLAAFFLTTSFAPSAAALDTATWNTFAEKYCVNCHNETDHEAGLDLTSLSPGAPSPAHFLRWVKVHDRLEAGAMPPPGKPRPAPAELTLFLQDLSTTLDSTERTSLATTGRATQRRLNAYEYEHALQDLLHAPWLQLRGQFPEDGEALRFNKLGEALDVSHVHLARYMAAADHAIREVLASQLERPAPSTRRYYARDQRTLTSKFTPNIFNSSPDRMTYPVIDATAQPEVRLSRAPLTVGSADPALRDREAVGWVSSNYVTGFTYRWDEFRAPASGRYRIRFSGYTLWSSPGGVQMRFASERDTEGTPRPPNPAVPDYDRISAGRTTEPITVYTRNGVMNRRVGEFDLTPEPSIHDLGEVWLVANETLVPDASRFYRSRPNNFRNPLMTPDGTPSVAFRWMEVEGPLHDDSSGAGYRLLFGDLPLRRLPGREGGVTVTVVARGDRREGGRNAGRNVVPLEEISIEVVSAEPRSDADRLLAGFLRQAYRHPAPPAEVSRFLELFDERMRAGLSFTEAMLACYTAILASPGFVFLRELPGALDDHALATRLSLFLSNSIPDQELRSLADRGELRQPQVLRRQAERLLNQSTVQRFSDAFLDYWIDLRKIEDTTPSTTLYNDYYLDDALTEAALAESRLFFRELLSRDLPARLLITSDFTFLNERLALHYGIPGVHGIAMRRVKLPPESPRGGLMTQASILKVTANGTTTSPVLRGKWIVERILGLEIPPPPPVAAVEPDIRGAVTIRQQLDRHRADASCASCHRRMDPPGFALESFDVMGAWRDRYRGVSPEVPPARGLGKNGQPFAFHFGLAVDATGELPDGRPFRDVREFKQLLLGSERQVARNLLRQLAIYATGSPSRFSDRAALEHILDQCTPGGYGVRSLALALVASPLFQEK